MKLHEILGRILTDFDLRQAHKNVGVCELVGILAEADLPPPDRALTAWFDEALYSCTQTDTWVYPVRGPSGASRDDAKGDYRDVYHGTKNFWRGEYGVNRRKLVRDCWRWAKERDV
jgi:hypothetical protein